MLDSLFLAQAATAPQPATGDYAGAAISIAIAAAVLILPFVFGALLSGWLRMPGYGTKIGWSLFAVSLSTAVMYFYWPPKLGVDLSGGTVLVYEKDEEATRQMNQSTGRQFSMEALCQALTMRVNPDGLKEIVIRPFGEDQVEVIVPEVDPAEVSRLKRILNQPGFLEFRIVADQRDSALVALARDQAIARNDPPRFVFSDELAKDGKRKAVGYWAGIARDAAAEEGALRRYKWPEGLQYIVRDGNTGELLSDNVLLQIRALMGQSNSTAVEQYLAQLNIKPQVLMRVDEEYAVNGDDLSGAEKQFGSNGWQINFSIKPGDPSTRMGQMTGRNLKGNDQAKRHMAILLDGDVISAPAIQGRISDRGQITGNFTEEEVTFIVEVLRAGQLPAVLKKQPSSENLIDSTLGRETVNSGTYAAGLSLVVVMIFMLIYYRFAGIVANIALLMNIALTLALMMLFKAPLTLPGLAGLVLTVGMAVDANVLIFERIREEIQKGSALRMALRNGFDRAIVTIIDANLTTLFTAIVLYLRGTDQVRGFAITLGLGICTSMFTACYVARVIFDIAERNRWIRDLSMMRFLTTTKIPFTRMMVPAMVMSTVLIVIGVVGLIARGPTLFDIDLAGGTKVQWEFVQRQDPDQVRSKIEAAFDGKQDESKGQATYTLTPVKNAGQEIGLAYDLVSSFQNEETLKKLVIDTFKQTDGESLLKTYEMKIDKTATTTSTRPVAPGTEIPAKPADVTPMPETTEPAKEEPKAAEPAKEEPKAEAEKPAETPAEESASATCQAPEEESETEDAPKATDAEEKPAEDAKEESKPEEPAAEKPEEPAAEKPAEEAKPEPAKEEEKPAEPATTEETKPAEAPAVPSDLKPQPAEQRIVSVITEAQLSFPKAAISAEALVERVEQAAIALYGEAPSVLAEPVKKEEGAPTGEGNAAVRESQWNLKIALDQEQATKVLDKVKNDMHDEPVFLSSTKIGGQVAGDSKNKAVQAVLISLVMITAYIWLRFHKLSWGVAAVVALVHDTLVMLGAVAISFWLKDVLGVFGIEEFRISLTIIAAFLTLIGYSINDTIVIFDRIREVRGKNPDLTADMIDTSINQTLSRTILTSGTTLLVLFVLYVWGGPGVHGFAFSMLVGVISGTYSTIFIAAPLLLWMLGRGKKGLFSS